MSVRDGLLAVLSLGPAYGLQLHAEFTARAPHRAALNVGQVYSTLDRATQSGLVCSAGTTPDGLPLFRLTESGADRARQWMTLPSDGPASWTEMLDQVLVTATVDDPAKLAHAAEVIDQLGPACQLRLRRCFFSQAAAFTAALGVGVVLPKHVAVPEVVRDYL